jgi:DNA-binding transcriptional ArsR family regulator
MTKPVTDIDDPRLVKALAHPLRVRILALLENRVATPKQIAAELGLRLENVSYHVRILRDYGFIKLERKKQVRGAVEHHYRATARPRITAQAWSGLPAVVKEAMTGAGVSQLIEILSAAAEEGGFSHPESYFTRRPAVVDEQGFSEISKAITELLERVTAIEAEASKRIRRGDRQELPVIVAALLFDAPKAAAGELTAAKDGSGRRAAPAS